MAGLGGVFAQHTTSQSSTHGQQHGVCVEERERETSYGELPNNARVTTSLPMSEHRRATPSNSARVE